MTEREDTKVNFIPCGCGCGELIPAINTSGKPARFKYQHYLRLPIHTGRKLSEEHKKKIVHYGEKNWRWKGGKRKHAGGYMRIQVKGSPNTDEHGYKLEHRYVYEQFYKCCLLSWTVIHHKNRNRQDNRPENLEATTNSKHRSKHKKDMSNRRCLICKSAKTQIDKRGIPVWYRSKTIKGEFICKLCYDRIRLGRL